jgi:hypothetical protein
MSYKIQLKKEGAGSYRPPLGIYAEMKYPSILVLCVTLVAENTLIGTKDSRRTKIVRSPGL